MKILFQYYFFGWYIQIQPAELHCLSPGQGKGKISLKATGTATSQVESISSIQNLNNFMLLKKQ